MRYRSPKVIQKAKQSVEVIKWSNKNKNFRNAYRINSAPPHVKMYRITKTINKSYEEYPYQRWGW